MNRFITRCIPLLLLAGLAVPPASAQLVARQAAPTRPHQEPAVRISLREALTQLEKKYGIVFGHEGDLLTNRYVETDEYLRQKKAEAAVKSLLDPFGLTFKKLGKTTFVIKREAEPTNSLRTGGPEAAALPSLPSTAGLDRAANPAPLARVGTAILPLERTITGRVSDETGAGLPGVNIVVKETNRGTTTTGDGNFRLAVPDAGGTLVFSSIGYETQEIALGTRTQLDVAMKPSAGSLDEVVVVGYGTQRKKDVTGSVSSVSAERIQNTPVSGLDQALTGQLAGVQVQQTSGAPGGNINVRVRGSGSIGAGNEPLYVVDGFPGVTNLNAINPNDIESIEVLKDASAAAIYGSRGANGVVIITTKRGKAGRTTFSVDAYTGWQQVVNKVKLMNATQLAEHTIRARNNGYADVGGNTDLTKVKNSQRPTAHQIYPIYLTNDSTNAVNPALGVGTDWQDEIFQVAPVRNVEITATGGTDKIRYALTGGYFDQRGIVIESGFKRFSARINVDADLSRKLKIGFNLAPSFTKRDIVNSDDTWSRNGIIQAALFMAPSTPVRNPDDTFAGQYSIGYGINTQQNPVAIATLYDINSQSFLSTGNAYLDFQPLPGLNLRSAVGVNFAATAGNEYYPSTLGNGGPPPSQATGQSSSSLLVNWVNSNTLTYTRTFGQRHNLLVLVGNETQKQTSESNSLNGTKFPTDAAPYVSAAGSITAGSADVSEWSLLSYFGRVTYDFARKYLFTVNIRRDGSSRFGPNNRWGTFPSASVGWRIAEEPFVQGLNLLSEAKLRASYGLGGNNNIGNYAFRNTLTSENYTLGSGLGDLVTGLSPSGLGNPDLKWETSRQFDAGLDLGLVKDRIFLVVDYYDKITEDLLLNVNVPRATGYTSVLTNIGKVRNWGWEFTLNTKNLTGAFQWSTDFNISFNRNRVLALGPNGDPIISSTSQISPSNITEVGKPLGNFYGYVIEGVFNTQAEIDAAPQWVTGNKARPGDYRFRDVNGDKKIDALDRTIIGNAFPDFIYGLTNSFSYKNFDLSMLIQGSQGGEIINGTRRFLATTAGNGNQLIEIFDGWKSPEQPGNGYARAWSGVGTTNNNAGGTNNSKWVEDGSYLRIRTVSLGYRVPAAWLKRVSLQSLRVYGLVQNAFTFTNYKGYNPEASFSARSVLNPGVDYGTYPLARTITVGFNLGF
jgi:TonB-linked SusC/RagA family outer membrane protein